MREAWRQSSAWARSASRVAVVLVMIGCGEAMTERSESGSSPSRVAAPGSTSPGEAGVTASPPPPAMARKIIYNARVDLVVQSLTSAEQELSKLIKTHGGYLAETDVGGRSGLRRQGTWKVRVPVLQFDGFLAAVVRLGELQQTHIDSQDVTQEFYDLEARIANKQEEEKRLLKHLADSTGKLEDILAVERELSRVRGEVEQMQGRLRYLANQADLSTVTITASELRDYIPPVSASFATQVGRTFRESIARLVDLAKFLALIVVAAVPWFLVLALIGAPTWVVARRWLSARSVRAATRPGP